MWAKRERQTDKHGLTFSLTQPSGVNEVAVTGFAKTLACLEVQWDSALILREAVRGLFFTGVLAYS